MRIGILNTNPTIHGGSSLALNWYRSFCLLGADVKLFAMSRSGKWLRGWRLDCPQDVLSTRDIYTAIEYIRQFDVVIPLAGFLRTSPTYVKPEGMIDILDQAKTIFTYHGSFHGKSPSHLAEMRDHLSYIYGSLHNVIGIGVGGEVVAESFKADPVLSEVTRRLEFYVMRHPTFIPWAEPRVSDGRGLLSAVRFVPSKGIPKLLRVVQSHPEIFDDEFPFEIWGDGSISRELYLVRQNFPELMNEKYRGSYDSYSLANVMARGAFTADMSNYVSGAQSHYFESLVHGLVPITMRHWIKNDAGIPLDGVDPESVLQAILRAKRMDYIERRDHVRRGWNHITKFHNPFSLAGDLVDHLTNLLARG